MPEVELEGDFVKIQIKKMKKLYKKQKKCVAPRRKCIKEYFHHISDNNIVTDKDFWNFIRPISC